MFLLFNYRSSDVLEPTDCGRTFFVVEIPTLDHLNEIYELTQENQQNSNVIPRLKEISSSNSHSAKYFDESTPDIVVHFTPLNVTKTSSYKNWMKSFPATTSHLIINEENTCLGLETPHRVQYKLNMLSSDIFPLLADDSLKTSYSDSVNNAMNKECNQTELNKDVKQLLTCYTDSNTMISSEADVNENKDNLHYSDNNNISTSLRETTSNSQKLTKKDDLDKKLKMSDTNNCSYENLSPLFNIQNNKLCTNSHFENILKIEKENDSISKRSYIDDASIVKASTGLIYGLRPLNKFDLSKIPILNPLNYLAECFSQDNFKENLISSNINFSGLKESDFNKLDFDQQKIFQKQKEEKEFRILLKNQFFNKPMLENLTSQNSKNLNKILQESKKDKTYPILLFLGTGSCIPNKSRNTSAILVTTSADTYLLLDCGEGTYGQLVRHFGIQRSNEILRQLTCIFISHRHADHHSGLIGLLFARREAFLDIGITKVCIMCNIYIIICNMY